MNRHEKLLAAAVACALVAAALLLVPLFPCYGVYVVRVALDQNNLAVAFTGLGLLLAGLALTASLSGRREAERTRQTFHYHDHR